MAYALQEYIESSYHLRDETLIAERKALLESCGVISQEPYIEATPSYKTERTFSELDIDSSIKDLFAAAGLEKDVSVFDPPYSHQAEALEAVLEADDDLIVSTGTGSGKTETFLFPILATLFRESEERPSQAMMTGARAIVLYPMNALVNDQLFRLRKLLHKSDFGARLAESRGRRVRFAAYTGRMPYPGRRTAGKDTRYVAPIFDEFYLPLLTNPEKRILLESGGRWPAKDLERFYRADLREDVTKKRKGIEIEANAYHWDKRLITQDGDSELFTRDEVLKACPDILITNYSMLEYMLIRPIERVVFEQTRAWLHSGHENRLSLVIDEAHLYRGAAGAEIAMLIRRLMARLEVPRERIRCIITSASIGEGDRGIEVARRFAEQLTGSPTPRRFRYIGSTLDLPTARGRLSAEEQACLAQCKVEAIRAASEHDGACECEELDRLAQGLRWPQFVAGQPLLEYLYNCLVAWPPVGALIEQVTRAGTTLSELVQNIGGNESESAIAAVAALLEMCSLARRDGRVLLPARVHLFFRGLPGIWACVNPECDARRVEPGAAYKVGRFYDAPRSACECSRHARVFELLSHRDCGAAFIQAFVDSVEGDFLWSEGGELPDEVTRKLVRVELLIDGEPHPDFPEHAYERASLDVVSGKLMRHNTAGGAGCVPVYVPRTLSKKGHLEFSACPICQQSWRPDNSRIERHNTRGDNPFVAVLREQIERQPLPILRPDQRTDLSRFPNRGKKALVFSDGRQRAARLARIVPEVISQDAFRQALCRAVALRSGKQLEARLDNKLYTCFVKICSECSLVMFAGESRSAFRQQMREVADKDIQELLEDDTLEDRVSEYGKMLYWALSNPYYSLHVLGIAYVVAAKQVMPKITQEVESLGNSFLTENLEALTIMWVRAGLREYVFDRKIDAFFRQVVSSTPKEVYSGDGLTAPTLRKKILATGTLSEEALASFEGILRKHLMEIDANNCAFLKPSSLALRIAVDADWYRCKDCQACHPVQINGLCAECYCAAPEVVGPESPYMISRKDLWRRPIRRTIDGRERPVTFLAAEHPAQLSHRDRAEAHATTELHELRFQDILIGDNDEPIDVLSCTTTMEVGIDIGSLVAVAMRNIPPERSNYQQRAGRAGRRGSGLSTVMAFAELMPHDAYYFANPDKIVRGTPRTPEINISNPKIAARHVNAYVFQRFFSMLLDRGFDKINVATGLAESFGKTEAFFHDELYEAGLSAFSEWLHSELQDGALVSDISAWLPRLHVDLTLKDWISRTCLDLLVALEERKATVPESVSDENSDQSQGDEPRDDEGVVRKVPAQLLEYLSDSGLLPTYALPRHVASFLVERYEERNGYRTVRAREMPQQELRKALSEYAPGRVVTVNGVDYRSGAVTAATPFTVKNRAERLFVESQRLLTCANCDFVRMVEGGVNDSCPICRSPLVAVEMIEPEVFLPDDMNGVPENDRQQERTYVTGAQLPLPIDEDHLPEFVPLGVGVASTYAPSQELIILNRGPERQGERAGFWICELCGQAELDRPQKRHKRAYRPEGKIASPYCDGQHRNALLGQVFRTDLLVLRFGLRPPVISDITNGLERYLLHSAFETISQALVIATSRHRDIDVDSQEFGSGYRFLPKVGDTMRADVYLYDTLEGGAGFSEIAHAHIGEIAQDIINLLESCPAKCARSCTRCLRHFKNQHITPRLDRRLAAALLRVALYGNESLEDLDADPATWSTVSRILETDGLKVEHQRQGLRVSRSGTSVDVYAYKPILQEASGRDIVTRQHGGGALAFNEISLLLDPPNVHAAIRAKLPLQYTILTPNSVVARKGASGLSADMRIIAPLIDSDGDLGYRCKDLAGGGEQIYKGSEILIIGDEWDESTWDPSSDTIVPR